MTIETETFSTQYATVDLVDEWLGLKGVTLWGDWDITDPAQRRLAAEWLATQMWEYSEWAYWNPTPHEIKAGAWDVVV
jgi:hypothetical protein